MADYPVSLSDINDMDEDEFVDTFGDVAEHSPWVAAEAADHRPFHSRAAMIAAFAHAIQYADPARQRALFLAHPDLAGRAAISGEMAHESKKEQAGAGLDKLTADEFRRFTEMNTAYRDRHGIPFIFAVRGATKHDILKGYESRVGNEPEVEFQTALGQVERIIQFRLEDRVSP